MAVTIPLMGLDNGSKVLDVARDLDDFLRILAPFNQRTLAEIVRLKVDHPPYLFRGDKDDHPLVAHIGSQWQNDLDRREREMLRHLRKKFESYNNLSDWDLVALARHYGVKTRYLDWTSNALVALTFAIGEHNGLDGQPVVWVLETRPSDFDIPADESSPYPKGNGISTKIYTPSEMDSRVAFQNSYMMRQVFVQGHGHYEIEPVDVNPTFSDRIWKIPIALDCCQEIERNLKRLGYTIDALSPKINWDELCEECNDIMKGNKK